MQTLDAYATTPDDVAALAPVWWAMEADERGTFYATPAAASAARREGLWPLAEGWPPRESDRPLLLTGVAVPAVSTRRLVVLDGSFDTTAMPDEGDGHLWLSASPRRGNGESLDRSVVVGVPQLDYLRRFAPHVRSEDVLFVGFVLGHLDRRDPQHVAIMDGWLGSLQALSAAAGRHGWHVIVHGIDGSAGPAQARAREVGDHVTYVDRLTGVWGFCDVVASDSRRVLFTAAGHGRPVVVLSDPWRGDLVTTDLGPFARGPGQVTTQVLVATQDTAGTAHRRGRAVEGVYPAAVRDGRAAERAADAIRRWALV